MSADARLMTSREVVAWATAEERIMRALFYLGLATNMDVHWREQSLARCVYHHRITRERLKRDGYINHI